MATTVSEAVIDERLSSLNENTLLQSHVTVHYILLLLSVQSIGGLHLWSENSFVAAREQVNRFELVWQ